ncbi:MAG TPA: hypothetical protein VI485_22705 [Vicinamibacterales bacterium]|nr:hypothetical protein [Vicinamibacterales bacterium]
MLELPKDVVEFLSAAASVRTPALRINPLSLEQCIADSTRIREIPVAAELGLIVLDEADDSNPYCLITRGPASGMVVHFSHDSEPTLAFPDLATFLHALRAAVRDNRNIDQLEHHQFSPLPDQPALRSTLHALLESDDEDASTVLAILFPLLDPDERDIVLLAASNIDFLIREVAALFVEAHPAVHFRQVARALSEDAYPQVARPALRALQHIADPTVNDVG